MFGVGNPTFTNYFWDFGPTPGMLGVGTHVPRKCSKNIDFYTVWEPPGILNRMCRMCRMKATWYTAGSSEPRFLTRLRPG